MTEIDSLSVVKFLKSRFPADFPTAVLALPEMVLAFTAWVGSTQPRGIWKTSQGRPPTICDGCCPFSQKIQLQGGIGSASQERDLLLGGSSFLEHSQAFDLAFTKWLHSTILFTPISSPHLRLFSSRAGTVISKAGGSLMRKPYSFLFIQIFFF